MQLHLAGTYLEISLPCTKHEEAKSTLLDPCQLLSWVGLYPPEVIILGNPVPAKMCEESARPPGKGHNSFICIITITVFVLKRGTDATGYQCPPKFCTRVLRRWWDKEPKLQLPLRKHFHEGELPAAGVSCEKWKFHPWRTGMLLSPKL